MGIFLAVIGLLITIVLSVGIPTLLFAYGFSLPWLKALAVTLAVAVAARK